MQVQEAKEYAKEILRLAGGVKGKPRNFLEIARLTADAALDLPASVRDSLPWFKDWARTWKKLHDDFDRVVQADPMVQYEPAHGVARAFHSSPAFVRYFKSGNRTAKTQTGYAEHYLVHTGQHQWRKFIRPPTASFIIGVDYKHYAQGVFEAKFISGEVDNPLSPMFPEGGKWLHHYDDRKHIIQIACTTCANVGKAKTCSHQKSTIQLFSDIGSWEQLQGAQYALGHFDEHVDRGFYNEARQRTKTVQNASLIVTGTPLFGFDAWEYQLLTKRFVEGGKANLFDPDDPNSDPYVSIHQISQWDAGIVPHAKIKADMADMDEFEIRSRVYGEDAPFTDTPVFDRKRLAGMLKDTKDPQRCFLTFDGRPEEITPDSKFIIKPDNQGPLRLWEEPEDNGLYLCSVDTAAGLRDGDASCATIFKVEAVDNKIHLNMVAQWHGWMTPLQYAEEVFKLCVWYNSALCVVELTGGLGRAVVLKIKDEFHYWNLYRERADFTAQQMHLDPRFGVDTNTSTKPFMVAALQLFLNEGRITIPCKETLQELQAYEQSKVGIGGTKLVAPKFQGAKGAPDDRTMSLVIAASTAVSYQQLLYQVQYKKTSKSVVKVSPFWQQVNQELKEEDNAWE